MPTMCQPDSRHLEYNDEHTVNDPSPPSACTLVEGREWDRGSTVFYKVNYQVSNTGFSTMEIRVKVEEEHWSETRGVSSIALGS